LRDDRSISRGRRWTEAQTLTWIIFRTGAAVDTTVAEDDATGKTVSIKPDPGAGAMLAIVDVTLDAPYRRDTARGTLDARRASIPGISEALRKLRAAIAARKVEPDCDGAFDSVVVKALWPGRGKGNAVKLTVDKRRVNKLAQAIRKIHRGDCAGLGGPREELLSRIGFAPVNNREDRGALFRAAIRVAIGRLVLRPDSLASEWLQNMSHAERRGQMKNALSWRGRSIAK
jgi:hypothetical protein